MRMQAPSIIKMNGKTPNELREKLNLPPILSEDCVYALVSKYKYNNSIHNRYHIESYAIVCPNVAAYDQKYQELRHEIENTAEFDDLSDEAKFILEQSWYHEAFIDDIHDAFGGFLDDVSEEFVLAADKEEDNFFVKLTNLSIEYQKDYFGETDMEFIYEANVIKKKDIPEIVLEELLEDYDLEEETEVSR